MKSREPSDLTEEQGGYGGHFLQAQAQEREGRRSSQRGPLDLLVKFISGFRGWKDRSFDIWIREIAKSETPTKPRQEVFEVGKSSTWTRGRFRRVDLGTSCRLRRKI
jgi:hypothetical protein